MSRIDLHMHSRISSDGEFSPAEVVRISQAHGVTGIALTDHNSVRGNAEAAQEAALLNITFIPGIEMDCTIHETGLHILGYGINPDDPAFMKIEENVLKEEQLSSSIQMELVAALDIAFDESKVLALAVNGVVTPEMIAEIALEDERNKNHRLMQPFYPGGPRSDNPYVNFYWDICAAGRPAYVKIKYISLPEATDTIHASGGVAVLAHPGNNIGMDESLLQEIVHYGIDGIEVYSSYHNAVTTDFYRIQAEKYGLIRTSGSDFHGKTKPAIQPGCVPCDDREETILLELMTKFS